MAESIGTPRIACIENQPEKNHEKKARILTVRFINVLFWNIDLRWLPYLLFTNWKIRTKLHSIKISTR